MKLNVEAVMSQVRTQVLQRGGAFGQDGEESQIGAYGAFPRWAPTTAAIAIKPSYELFELLAHSDRAFVESAYLALLRRLPDPEGLRTYVTKLRAGELTKIDVLAALRWSTEGNARGIHVNGLLAPFLIQKWRRKRFIGPFLAWAMALLRIGRHADWARQVEAAQAGETHELGRLVNAVSQQMQTRFVQVEEDGHDRAEALSRQVEELKRRIDAQAHEIERLADPEKAQYREIQRQLDPLYVAFEERFRGAPELIRERALPYIDIMRSAGAGTKDAPVIDLGCGRGDWLDLLREHGLVARGIDSNRAFIGICKERGLDVIEGDVLTILHSMPDGSVGAVTGMHIAEHLPFEVLVTLLDECRRVLRAGGILALETPNPENLWVASHYFYMDPTHRNPLPPLALLWIVEARGFADARIERWTVARDLHPPPLLAPEMPGAASMNVLLGQLHAAPDYAIVARRPA